MSGRGLPHDPCGVFVLQPVACVDYERMNGVETGRSEQSCCGASIELANVRVTHLTRG